MDSAHRQLLRVLAGRTAFRHGVIAVCPICFEPTGALTDGARMGAALLAAVLVIVLAGLGRFGWRLARAEAHDASQVVDGEHPPMAPPRSAP